MNQVDVTLLAFGERQPASLAVVNGVPSLIVYRHLYKPTQLPLGSQILITPDDDLTDDARQNRLRLIEAARREGFDVVVDGDGLSQADPGKDR